MKTTLRAAAIAVALSLAGSASAQQQPNHVRVGLGVGLPTSELSTLFAQVGPAGAGATGLTPAQIYVPIDFTPSFRLEPEVGLISISESGGNGGAYYTFGTGAFYMMPLAQQAHMYVGGRLLIGLDRSTSNDGATKTKGTDWYVAGTFGGEVLPHPRIGLGAEAQLGRWWIGDRDTTTNGFTSTSPGGSSWQTQGIIFVRLYFN